MLLRFALIKPSSAFEDLGLSRWLLIGDLSMMFTFRDVKNTNGEWVQTSQRILR
jgi:hypothetical protein